MTAVEALRAARAAGVAIALDGDDLVLEASSLPPEPILDALSRNKVGIVNFLRPGDDGWCAEDWQVDFDERAGIAEFDGGLPRPEAEAQAFACCVAEWLNRHPQTSPPDRCFACQGGDSANDPCCPSGPKTAGTPGCTTVAGGLGTRAGKRKLSPRSKAWASRNRPTFQKISGKTGAHDGWHRIGTACRSGA